MTMRWISEPIKRLYQRANADLGISPIAALLDGALCLAAMIVGLAAFAMVLLISGPQP